MKKWRVLGLVGIGTLLALRFNRELFPVRVSGESMLPALRPGDLLVARLPRRDEPRLGQIVIVDTPERETVKRVVEGPVGPGIGEAGLWVEGDNDSGSTDSRTFGPVTRGQIVGIVRARYRPLRRVRLFA